MHGVGVSNSEASMLVQLIIRGWLNSLFHFFFACVCNGILYMLTHNKMRELPGCDCMSESSVHGLFCACPGVSLHGLTALENLRGRALKCAICLEGKGLKA